MLLGRSRANGNSIPSAFWMVAEVIRDPQLLSKVRSIVAQCHTESEPGSLVFDFGRLCNDPLLQSIYAETLRLHIASFLSRGPDRKDFNLKGWRIPRDATMLISSYNAQMDPQVWSRKDNPHSRPVNEFCAERFLELPKESTAPSNPGFSLKGRANAWIPYGGGARMCPGRHFAKQEMISSLAIMLTLFDIEVVDPSNGIPANDMAGFGFGALCPKGAMPVRMRRRSY
jgi:cytochrome P450